MKRIIKTLLFPFFLLLSLTFTFAQEEDQEEVKEEDKEQSFRQLFTEAGYHIEFGNYNLALEAYLQLDSMNPDNSNIQYRIGVCYLKSTEKAKAIPYLEKAIQNTSRVYDDLIYTEKTAPWDAYYQLAKAYHLNYQIDTAIATFKKYKSLLHKKHYLQEEIDRQMEMAVIAKEIIAEPIDVEITNLGSDINTQYADFCPVINADETMMIFTSRRKGSTGGEQELDGRYFEDIYVSYNESGVWATPKKIGASINTSYHEAAIGLSADGQRLFVYKDDEGDGNIYQSFLMGDTWTVPEKLGSDINTEDWETHATITPDGSTLYFISDRKKGGYGGRDIYKCTKLPNGEWSFAQNLGPGINTKYDEEAPFIHPDGITLFFSSKGHRSMGGFDIFFTELSDDGQWSEPMNIGYPINTPDDDVFYIQSTDGLRAYYSSVNVKKGLGEKDIYRVEHIGQKKKALTVLKGIMSVTDIEGSPISAQIIVTDNDTKEKVVYQPNTLTGKFLIILNTGKDYSIDYAVDDSIVQTKNLNISEGSSYQEIDMEVLYKPTDLEWAITEDTSVSKQPIAYDTITAGIDVIDSTLEISKTVETVETVETVDTVETVEAEPDKTDEIIVIESFQEFFNYNVKSINTNSSEFKSIIKSIVSVIESGGSIKLTVEASASKVPTRTYGTNKNLADKRAEEAKVTVIKELKAKGIDESKVACKISALVQGPAYKNDPIKNKAVYEKYQYVKIGVDQ
ncbi:MAG: tetratricopeptide repeat protein [Bacteroidota bacterium]